MRIGIGIVITQIVILSWGAPLLAEEVDSEAKAFYEQGKVHFEAGRFEEALGAFNEAYNRSGEPKLLYNLAAAAEGMGDRERAKAYYQVYLEETPDAPDSDDVRARIEKLSQEPVSVPTDSDPEPEPAAAQAPDASTTTQLPDTENIDAAAYYQSEDKGKKKRGPVWPAVTIGVGGMVLAGGMISAILAKTRYDGLSSTCSPDCTAEQVSGAKAPAVAADVLFGLGGIAVTAGIIGVVLLKKKKKENKSAVRVLTGPLPGGAFLGAKGSF